MIRTIISILIFLFLTLPGHAAIKKIFGASIFTPAQPAATSVLFAATGGSVSKISLSDFTESASLNPFSPDTPNYGSGIGSGNFVYFVSDDSPGRVAKVSASAFTLSDSLTLTGLDTASGKHCIATDDTYLYLCTSIIASGNNAITRIDLSTFTVTSTLDLAFSGNNGGLTIDTDNDVLYYSDGGAPSEVYPISTSTFTAGATLTITGGAQQVFYLSEVSDGFFYAASANSPTTGRVTQISTPGFTQTGQTANISGGFTRATSVGVDTTNGNLMVGSSRTTNPLAHVAQVSIASLTVNTTVQMTLADCRNFQSLATDSSGGFTYFGSFTTNTICKVQNSDLTEIATLNPTGGGTIFDLFLHSF